ncbi:trypsin-like serine protease [Mycoplasmatota bacterium]|nr:trypsin-like serine protease [Mycoplasmatota bacterium]
MKKVIMMCLFLCLFTISGQDVLAKNGKYKEEIEEISIDLEKVVYDSETGQLTVGDRVLGDYPTYAEAHLGLDNDIKSILPTPSDDDRVRVTDTTADPYSGIVHLKMYYKDVNNDIYNGYCTGAMIDANSVLTAGHCLYDHKDNLGWAYAVTVSPGVDENTNHFSTEYAATISVASQWESSGSTNHDWGVITLSSNVDSGVKIFDLHDNVLIAQNINLTGYPNTTPDATSKTMWTADGPVYDLNLYTIEYKVDATSGQSGSPVYDSQNRIVAIHNGGVTGEPMNIARKMSSWLKSYLESNHIS